VLLALRWERIPAWFLRLSGAAAVIFMGALAWLIGGLSHAVPDVIYAAWQLAGVWALLALALSAVVGTGAGVRRRLPAAVAGTWLALGLALSPFDGPFLPSPGGPGLEALRAARSSFPWRGESATSDTGSMCRVCRLRRSTRAIPSPPRRSSPRAG